MLIYVGIMLYLHFCRKEPFYLKNKSLPVFEWNAHTYKVPEIVQTLLSTSVSSINVCFCTPTNVEHNCTFLVDQSKLKCVQLIWEQTIGGSRKNNGVRSVVIDVSLGNVSIVARGKEVKASIMVHDHYQHCACPDFRKIISYLHFTISC